MKKETMILAILIGSMVALSGCIEALFSSGIYNTPANCTQFGGRLLLKDYSMAQNSIKLTVQNGSSGEISSIKAKASGFAARINGVEDLDSLPRSDNAEIVFSGNTEKGKSYSLIVSYSSNGINHEETTTCTVAK
ncbi:MAG: hypothetical protein Q7R70_04245 [Candidatus Diapherotrites archaeon]|nr:hypothetical protein [Candidatus Diapherotrites archaeon]